MRLAAAICCALLCAVGSARAAAIVDRFPGAAASYLVVADGTSLWGVHAETRLPPASLTKLMTALITAEKLSPGDVIPVSANAARATGARMGLAAGATLSVDDLLAGLLVRSGNDACVALAERVAGSEAAFVALMNERAREWGLANTRFTNACGFDAVGHYASAADLAVLAQRVLEHPVLARWSATGQHTAIDRQGRRYPLATTNVLLALVPGMNGIKTGYTSRAGRCLAVHAERDGHRVLVVLLGGKDRWWDAVAMIEQAFQRLSAGAPAGSR